MGSGEPAGEKRCCLSPSRRTFRLRSRQALCEKQERKGAPPAWSPLNQRFLPGDIPTRATQLGLRPPDARWTALLFSGFHAPWCTLTTSMLHSQLHFSRRFGATLKSFFSHLREIPHRLIYSQSSVKGSRRLEKLELDLTGSDRQD